MTLVFLSNLDCIYIMSKFNALATLNRVLQPLVERADDNDVRARVTITEEGDCQKRRYLINSTFHCYYLSFLLKFHLKIISLFYSSWC